MTIIRTSIFYLLDRFPNRKSAIKTLFEQSQSFKALCEDHRKCLAALQYWNRCVKTDAPYRKQEYEALIRELEEEISDMLTDFAETASSLHAAGSASDKPMH